MSASLSRDIIWTAYSCHLDGANLYIGLAAGLDDELAQHLTPRQIATFPWQEIAATRGDHHMIPLRVYAVRDSSIVTIEPAPNGPPINGFQRMHLRFRPSVVEDAGARTDRHDDDKFTPPGTVMAFVLTIGLPIEREDAFYDVIVRDFLHKSWMSLPELLQNIGCAHPEEIAAKQ